MGDPRSRRLLTGLVGVLLLVVVLAACGDGVPDTQPLAENGFLKSEVEQLPGGGRVAAGSPDGHRIEVQFRGKDATGWSRPRTIYSEAKMFTHDLTLVVAGSTVAIDPDYWTQRTLEDDDDPDHTVQVLCRARACGHGRRSPFLSGTELDATGTFASFGLGRGKVLLWDDGSYRTTSFTGVPAREYPEMFPDGSFGVVAPEEHGSLCRYRLLASEPRKTALTPRAVSGDYPASQPCDTSSTDLGRSKATVSVESLDDSVDFVRAGGTWSVDEPRRRLEAYPDTRGRSSLKNDLANRSDDSTVSIGSPDTKRIFAQYRGKETKEWTRPVQVATAPAGTSCRFQSVARADLAVTDLISCFDTGKPFKLGTTKPTAGLGLATADGRTWEVRTLDRPDPEVQPGGGKDQLFVGATRSYVWSPTTKMRTIHLPIDTRRDNVTSTPNGKILRVSGNPTGAKACAPTYQVADLDATSWPKARPVPHLTRTSADDDGCAGTIFPDGEGAFDVEFWYAWTGTIEPRGGDWVAVKSDVSR